MNFSKGNHEDFRLLRSLSTVYLVARFREADFCQLWSNWIKALQIAVRQEVQHFVFKFHNQGCLFSDVVAEKEEEALNRVNQTCNTKSPVTEELVSVKKPMWNPDKLCDSFTRRSEVAKYKHSVVIVCAWYFSLLQTRHFRDRRTVLVFSRTKKFADRALLFIIEILSSATVSSVRK